MWNFLSPEWLQAMQDAAAASRTLGSVAEGVHLVIEHEVSRKNGDVVRYHVTLQDRAVRVQAGPSPEAAIRFTQDEATAQAIAQGQLSAQRAFMAGQLRVGGDLSLLVSQAPLLAELGDIFAGVRSQTDFGTVEG